MSKRQNAGASRDTHQHPLLNHNRMNSEHLVDILRSSKRNSGATSSKSTVALSPIHIVTATFLDPRRYHSFLYIWLYLLTLFGAQLVQYSWIKRIWGRKWRSILGRWRDRVQMFEGIGPVQQKFMALEWYAFKRDLEPESTREFLHSFARWRQQQSHDKSEHIGENELNNEQQEHHVLSDRLVTLGASYVDPRMPNVVFLDNNDGNDKGVMENSENSNSDSERNLHDDLSKRIDGESITTTQTHVDNTSDVGQVAHNMIRRLNHSVKNNDNDNYDMYAYQKWEALNTPVWKSRFIIAPKQLPTMEELDAEVSDSDVTVAYNDPAPLNNEFKAYLFEGFLNDMQPEMDQRSMSHNERVAFILRDVERDRVHIIRDAIQKAKALSIK